MNYVNILNNSPEVISPYFLYALFSVSLCIFKISSGVNSIEGGFGTKGGIGVGASC
ncbi:MAG: hypothetical protein KKA10_17295 [Euryarchaeota archaeon]|nr:hypothetical protein [Euryarchaeota archaeon]MCG2738164.1 hypothetical protein [Candidatus Methanoperedenaceae archaeon]